MLSLKTDRQADVIDLNQTDTHSLGSENLLWRPVTANGSVFRRVSSDIR